MSKAPKTAEQRTFEQLNNIAGSQRGAGFIDRLFAPLFRPFNTDSNRWDQDAYLCMQQQKIPRARALLYSIALAMLALLVWSAFAEIDEITRGEGKVIPSRQLQVIQSVDGGVVEEIFVEEGDLVSAGQLLARVDPTRFVASAQEQGSRIFSLQIKILRLKALIEDQEFTAPDSSQLSLSEQNQLLQEQRFYNESQLEHAQRMAIAEQQLRQKEQELNEGRARLNTARQTYSMTATELSRTKPLLETGAISEVEVLRLEREVASARGELNQASARLQQLQAGVEEAQGRVQETAHSARNRWSAELSEATSQLSSLQQSQHGLADRVKFAEIRSPVNGTVQRVLVNTVGGVVQPGNAVLEIVPQDERLVVEAKISPRDIAFLRPNLPAMIKFHAYDFSVYGGMHAQLQHISADSITDERDNTYYLIRVVSSDSDNNKFTIIPGMTAQVDIMTGKKTVLSYLLKPILRAKANALSER